MTTAARLQRLPWQVRYRLLSPAASQLRKLAIRLTHLHAHVTFEGPVWIGPGFELRIPDRGTLRVEPNVTFRRRFVCEISGDGAVTIGERSIFTAETLIQCSTSVDIGPYCTFGQSTLIVDGNHRFRDPDRMMHEQGYDYRPIRIGAGALILTKCTIVNDVGERAVVGANSVVTKPVPPYCVAVGSPARVIEYFGPPDRRPAGLEV